MPAVERVIIDTDAGIDDAVAIALGLHSPEISVCAITTTYGNNTVVAATRNVRALLDRVGRPSIPVSAGASAPLDGGPLPPRIAHGPSGLGYATLPPLPRHVVPQPAALGRAIRQVPAPVTVVTMGPLTNLAWALRATPVEVLHRVRCHIQMGIPPTSPPFESEADFNTSADRRAAFEVLEGGLHTVAIPAEVARGVALTAAEVDAMTRSPHPFMVWLSSALTYRMAHDRHSRGILGCTLPDVAAIAAVIAPDVIKPNLDADNGDDHREGRPTGRHLETVFALDHGRVRDLLIRVLGTASRNQKGGME